MSNFDSTQQRREELLSKLIRYANGELSDEYEHLSNKIKTDWCLDDFTSPCLLVDTDLSHLLELLGRTISRKQKDNISYDLAVFQKIGISIDRRLQKKGSLKWRFTLKLWDKLDPDKNIYKFRELIAAKKNSKEDISSDLDRKIDPVEDNDNGSTSTSSRSSEDSNNSIPNENSISRVCRTINNHGTVNIVAGNNNHTTFNNDNSARFQASQQLLTEDILHTIESLDRRLTFVDTALAPDPVELEMSEWRQKTIPSAAVENTMSWWRLMSQQTAASLQHTLNSEPLIHHLNRQIIADLPPELDRKQMLDFEKAIVEVKYCTDTLIRCFQDIASNEHLTPNDREFYQDKISLESECLGNRSQIAYLQALSILSNLIDNPESIADRLSQLNHLQPQQLLPESNMIWMMTHLETAAVELSARRSELVRLSVLKLQELMAEKGRLDRLWEIQPTDAWNVVIGKAISLRQFGRISEAVAALDRYQQMFSSDPGASEYTRIAQQFTLQISDLQINGGIYIYDVNLKLDRPDRVLQIGDIIIGYGDRHIQNMVDITEAIRDTAIGEIVRISYLRVDRSGAFQSYIADVIGKPLGFSLMPI